MCRELDCGAPVQVLGAAAFDKGRHSDVDTRDSVQRNESQIHLCHFSSNENPCTHCKCVGLVCTGLHLLISNFTA